ncbi:hypothetical protein SAMN00120144_3116 [Hymenobacter roseosalivarius DSM 11622]|uniref:Uncharacterized protein n=1 Tax=Hymenobacter roseosalivarius DSM 11622 TaxID=645990 RepID=A0A1W1UE85_9BACT|nr:hypothetical protein [Hymenobacter roseosalivarius]SMB79349.1 hypothetical protein SAMN00120144_3116 [Hymenobacter roseosalivarius DSM 11622]
MNQLPHYYPSAPGFAAQEAYLIIEQEPRDHAEKSRLEKLRRYIQRHAHQADLRNLALAVQELMGTGYQVGCGSSHIWIKRLADSVTLPAPERLAIVADRLTTAFREWNAPCLCLRPE